MEENRDTKHRLFTFTGRGDRGTDVYPVWRKWVKKSINNIHSSEESTLRLTINTKTTLSGTYCVKSEKPLSIRWGLLGGGLLGEVMCP